MESLLQRANADVALHRECRGGQWEVRSGLDDVHRATDRCRSTRLRRSKCFAIWMVGHQEEAVYQAFHQWARDQRVPYHAVRAMELTVDHQQ